MSYNDRVVQYGKQAVHIVELHLPRCTRTYGVSPCTAAIGVTGSDKCFNTFSTCQDQDNFAQDDFIYRFSTTRLDNLQEEGDAPTFPTVVSVDTTSAVLTPGKGLGIRSSVRITLSDHPWTDVGCDPYVLGRSYSADGRGSFWGKFLSRNRYYLNRLIVVKTGYLEDDGSYDPDNFVSRSYIITGIDGPDAKGTVTINAKDPLRLADGEKAKLPQASSAKVVGDITDSDTTIVVSPADDLQQWWDWGQRYIRIEDEILSVSAQTGIGTSTATLTVTRGDAPTRYEPSLNITAAHKNGSGVVPCFWFPSQMIYDIVYFLLHDVAGIDASFLDYSGWVSHIDAEYPYLEFSAMLSEPIDVKTLLTEMTELGVYIWWHERDQLVKMRGVRPSAGSVASLNETDDLVADSVAVAADDAGLMTQAWLMYDINFPTANMTQLKNYRVIDVRANLDRETDVQYGYPSIRTIKSRWLSRAEFSVAVQINGNMLQQYQDVRRMISFQVDPKNYQFWTGDIITVATRHWQDETGLSKLTPYLVTQIEEVGGQEGIQYNVTGLEVFSLSRNAKITHPALTGDTDPPPADYMSATETERSDWVYISEDDGTMPDGAAGYNMI